MKKLLILALAAILIVLSSCTLFTKEEPHELDPRGGDAVTTTEEEGVFTRDLTIAASSSVLEDTSDYGFAYEPANVLDIDYSTAWCASGEKESPAELTLNFGGPIELGKVGIMPGFARDQAIFNKNNRLKTVEVWYDDKSEAVGELSFEDEYEMQFFSMPVGKVTVLKLKIIDVYAGSEFSDTCVAEVDFWSEWVTATQDADAAENYYKKYKADEAIRPVGVSKTTMSLRDALTGCGSLDLSPFETERFDHTAEVAYTWARDGQWAYSEGGPNTQFIASAGAYPAISLKMNDSAKEGDRLTVKWIKTSAMGPITPHNVQQREVSVKSCGDGSLYAAEEMDVDDRWGGYTVEVYYQNRLIARREFALAQ